MQSTNKENFMSYMAILNCMITTTQNLLRDVLKLALEAGELLNRLGTLVSGINRDGLFFINQCG